MSDTCGLCHGGPVRNANRWTGGIEGPEFLECPRCGKTWTPVPAVVEDRPFDFDATKDVTVTEGSLTISRPTHTHTVEVIDEGWDEDEDGRFPIRLHQVTCCFENDPGSDDSIMTHDQWVPRGAGTFYCGCCGDEIDEVTR